MILLLFILLLSFFIIGTPIYIALGLSGIITILLGTDIEPMIIVQRMVGGVNSFALMALPFFLLAANIMDSGGLSKRILNWARALVGHLSGGIAMATQLASMFFGSLSGSSPATIVAIGKIMHPDLIKQKYPKSFIGGLLASSGSVALIIPPSVTLIIYGAVTGASVGKLFMAGIMAGIIFGMSSLIFIYVYSKKNGLPSYEKVSRKELFQTTKDAAWALMIPVIILGGIYRGIFTPTESAGVSAIYALFVGMFIYKELTLKDLPKILIDSAKSSAQILILIASAQIFGWILTIGQVTQKVSSSFLSNIQSPVTFLFLLNIILLIMGMFIDGSAAITILGPIVLPIATQLGIDPVHLGIIMITNLTIGLYTPPFGLNIFVTSSITGYSFTEILPGIIDFLLVNLIALGIITYCPKLVMLFTNLAYN